ncbi:protein kinase [Kitasatospora sp. NPDC058965]|uniref:protein kinase domain-containing protein n=1 Tax=Kitasatospora sp. NPDC058965 TaxID=3346682 RepID=UPI003692BC1B
MRAGPGRTVAGRYRVTDRAGGSRLLAVDAATGARVLLEGVELPEVLVPELAGSVEFEGSRWLDPQAVLAEATAVLAALPEHPRLRQSFAVLAEEGTVWAAVELPSGVPLTEPAADGPMDPYRVAELAADLAGALVAVHRAGLVHGGVLAERVLVCEDGAALLGSPALGAVEEALARELGGADGRRWGQARAGLVGAVAERWPPELLAEVPTAGPAADLWALGVLLHRLLTGQGPFPDQTPTVLYTAVRAGQRLDSAACGPLRPLVDRLLAPAPAERPTAEQAREWLAELLAGAPEPYRSEPEHEVLPVLRPSWPLVRRQRRAADPVAVDHGRHARAAERRPSALVPVLLVGGVLAAMVAAMAAVVLLNG